MKKNKGSLHIFDIVLIALCLIVVGSVLFGGLKGSFTKEEEDPFTSLGINYVPLDSFFSKVGHFFGESVNYGAFGSGLKFIIIIFSLFFLTVIAYCAVRLLEIRKKEHEHLRHEIEEYAHHKKEKEQKKNGGGVSDNSQWIKVLEHTFSSNPAEWKMAIIDADIMLENLMDEMGFLGETLGDKLKSADQESFPELTRAWEVHTIRNRIAHEGLAFEVSNHESKRVVAIYEQIFRDYGFI